MLKAVGAVEGALFLLSRTNRDNCNGGRPLHFEKILSLADVYV